MQAKIQANWFSQKTRSFPWRLCLSGSCECDMYHRFTSYDQWQMYRNNREVLPKVSNDKINLKHEGSRQIASRLDAANLISREIYPGKTHREGLLGNPTSMSGTQVPANLIYAKFSQGVFPRAQHGRGLLFRHPLR